MGDAIAHEWVTARRGSERVFEQLAACHPDAELFALSARPDAGLRLGTGRTLTTTYLDRAPLRERRSVTLPLMPHAWSRMGRGRSFDRLIISHHAAAMQLARHVRAGQTMVYVHTPARYVWTPELDGRGSARLLDPLRYLMKRSDLRALPFVDRIAANSAEVAGRVSRFWDRESTIIHPPVDVDFFVPAASSAATRPIHDEPYVLGFSRFVRYKQLDVVIRVGEAAGVPVVLAGAGPDQARLSALASSSRVPVRIVVNPTDDELRALYRDALCMVYPGHEDFGIAPLEAQACGTPVVALARGGALETIRPGVSGFHVETFESGGLEELVTRCATLDPVACRQNALAFSEAEFRRKWCDWAAEGTHSEGAR